jgi:nicotinamidase-related amidase
MIQVASTPSPWPHRGLRIEETALLLIDMQRDFLEPDGYLVAEGFDLAEVRRAIDPARRLLDAARTSGLTILHTRQGYRPDLGELPPHRLQRVREGVSAIGAEGPLGRFLIRGEPGHEIIAELAPRDGEFVVDKSDTGAFWGTDLASILSARGARALIVAGVTTEVCVHSTVREAADRGFECLVVADACGSGDAAAHRAALRAVVTEGGVFGMVAEVDDVSPALSGADERG